MIRFSFINRDHMIGQKTLLKRIRHARMETAADQHRQHHTLYGKKKNRILSPSFFIILFTSILSSFSNPIKISWQVLVSGFPRERTLKRIKPPNHTTWSLRIFSSSLYVFPFFVCVHIFFYSFVLLLGFFVVSIPFFFFISLPKHAIGNYFTWYCAALKIRNSVLKSNGGT